ncbi:hypothetical protein HHX47_DHR2000951 [Lentinula edodes]|nr:hypothetical protein HHX47_DHR2000951 [Lentinula edodes]
MTSSVCKHMVRRDFTPTLFHKASEADSDEEIDRRNKAFGVEKREEAVENVSGTLRKEPVIKSPFRQAASSSSDVDLKQRKASPPAVPPPPRIPSLSGASPVRPSLVTKKMHGPRLSGAKREQRKTVTPRKLRIGNLLGMRMKAAKCLRVTRHHHPNEPPPDLETGDSVPLGRTHHADRVIKYHQEHESHPFVEPAPHTIVHTPTFPIHATAASPPPSTPSHRNRFSSPPLGRSTHFERLQSARIEEEDIDRDVKMLPDSPSPMKSSSKTHVDEASMDGLVPKFELPGYSPVRRDYPTGSDPFAMPNLQDESLPLDAGNFVQDDSIMSVTTTEHSEVNISALEKELGNERLINTSMEASPIDLAREASFTQADSPASAPVRRSPLPPIPSSVPHRISSPAMRSSSPLSPRGSVSPFASPIGARPRSNRDDVHRRFLCPQSFGSASPSGSPKINVDGGRGLRTSVDRQRIVDLSIEHSPEREDDHKEQLDSEINFERETEKDASSVMTAATENSAEMATIETAEKRKVVAVGVVQEHEPAETEASMEVTHDVTIDFEVKGEALQEQAEPSEPVHRDQPEPIAVTQAIELRDQSFSGDEVDSGMDDDDNNGEEFGLLKTPAFTNSKKLKFDLGSKFGLGKLGLLDLELSSEDLTTPSTSKRSDLGFGFNERSSELPPKSVQNMPVGSINVRMDMRNALDRLMDDVASVGGSTVEEPHEVSMTTTEEDAPGSHLMQRAATDYALVGSLGPPPGSSVHSTMPSRNASFSSITPPPPPKDNICAREAIIIEKRQKMRRMEEGDDNDDDGPLDNYGNEDDVDFFSEGKDEETTHPARGRRAPGQEPGEQLELNAETSITGLVDETFAGSHQTSTPRRHHPNEPPPDLETEDGVPLGRTHHTNRVIKYH